jgi:hypothetical protein
MWSLIRILLAVLNVIGVAAIIAMAATDYGKRHEWSYAVLLHDVAINGLPLDSNETTDDNDKLVDLIGESGKRENDLFSGQSRPVATQLEEVTFVKSKLDSAIAANPDKRVQLLTLARLLTPMAQSETQRQRLESIQRYLADPKSADGLKADLVRAATAAADEKRKPVKPFNVAFAEEAVALRGPSRRPFEEALLAVHGKAPGKKPEELFDDSIEQIRQDLQKTYDDAFAPALTGKLNGAELAPSARKAFIASLLFNCILPVGEIDGQRAYAPDEQFDLGQGPYRRFVAVVGMEAGVKAIQEAAQVLVHMSEDLRLEMGRDQSIFVTEHQKLVNQLQQSAAKEVALADALGRQKDLVGKQQALVNRRKQDVKAFEENLARLRKETAERLEEVRMMSDKLLEIRVVTRNASEANQNYEQKIRTLEEGR